MRAGAVCVLVRCWLVSSWSGFIACRSFFFFKQKTAYELRISDWSSDVCSSDLRHSDGEAAFRRKYGRADGAAAHDLSPDTARDMRMACPALGTALINRTGTNRGECLTMPCD